MDEVFKGCVLFLEAAMLEPETQVCGAVVVFDMEGLSMQQVWQFTPPFAKRIVDWLQVLYLLFYQRMSSFVFERQSGLTCNFSLYRTAFPCV